MTHNGSNYTSCNISAAMASNISCNTTAGYGNDTTDWPLERVVSMVVPVFFGIIGLIGLMGNALVIIGKRRFIRLSIENKQPLKLFCDKTFFSFSFFIFRSNLWQNNCSGNSQPTNALHHKYIDN